MSFIDMPILVGICLVIVLCLLGVVTMVRTTGKSGK